MFSTPRFLFALLVLWPTLQAEPSLDHARRAQALLGPEVWSRVIAIRNDSRGGTYPRSVHALVFELVGVLWFYCDVNGTQSFSLHPGQLDEEKHDFRPLLRDIEPGFGRWSVVEGAEMSSRAGSVPLPNGCFIESVVALRERVRRGLRTDDPRLLSYYTSSPSGQNGHTVFACDTGEGVEIFDPGRRGGHFVFSKVIAADPLALARALDGREVSKARYLRIRSGSETFGIVASTAALRSAAREGAMN